MSSILKALKKLEHDKVSYHPDELKIDAEILRTDTTPRISATGALLLSCVLLVGGSGTTYWYMKQDRTPEPERQTTHVQSSRPAPTTSPIKTDQLPDAIEVVPATQQKNLTHDSTGKYQQRNSVGTSIRDIVAPKLVQSGVAAKAVRIPPPSENHTRPGAPASDTAIPLLRVNGIAYRGEGSDSVAMVNGVPLTRGSVIEGVRVEDIFRNMVKFSFNGEIFEIRMGQANR